LTEKEINYYHRMSYSDTMKVTWAAHRLYISNPFIRNVWSGFSISILAAIQSKEM